MKQIVVDNQVTDYFITSDGKCWSNKTKVFMKGQISNSGYLNYNLTLPDGSKRRLYAHRLVAEYYIPNPGKKSQVNHKDGNKNNNSVSNLEWVTPSENQQHALRDELRSFQHVFCFDEKGSLIQEYKNIEEAARLTGTCRYCIQQEVNTQNKSCIKGHYWSYDKHLDNISQQVNCGVAKEVRCYKDGKLIKIFQSTGQAAKWLGVKTSSHIGECCRGKIKTYKGFVWKYTCDIV